jgi:hypothetical protein
MACHCDKVDSNNSRQGSQHSMINDQSKPIRCKAMLFYVCHPFLGLYNLNQHNEIATISYVVRSPGHWPQIRPLAILSSESSIEERITPLPRKFEEISDISIEEKYHSAAILEETHKSEFSKKSITKENCQKEIQHWVKIRKPPFKKLTLQSEIRRTLGERDNRQHKHTA